ncbi:MAG: hypothetical protein AAF547_15795 [Actinomycetota bacterium]
MAEETFTPVDGAVDADEESNVVDPAPVETGGSPGLGLLGVEIGATAVRLALLDSAAAQVTDAVERPIGVGDGSLDTMAEARLQTALLGALDVLGLAEATPLLMGVTIGMSNCGVGSGPALTRWLENLSARLDQQFVSVGDQGVSYAPLDVVAFLKRVFEPLPLHVDRIELAPVAACRLIEPLHPGEVTIGSGLAWSARVIGNEVVEAYEITGGAADQLISVASGGAMQPIERLTGVVIDETLAERRNLDPRALAPAVGVAKGLLTSPPSNLLAASLVRGPNPPAARTTMEQPIAVPNQPVPHDGYRGPAQAEQARPDDRYWEERGDRWPRPEPAGARVAAGRDPYGGDGNESPGGAGRNRYETQAAYGGRGGYEEPSRRVDDRLVRSDRQPPTSPGVVVSDFALGALLMLLLVQAVALILL